MSRFSPELRMALGCLFWALLGAASARPSLADPPPAGPPPAVAEPAPFALETLRGKAYFLGEVLARKWGVRVVEEARERVLAIETEAGEVVPVAEDVRGRAFRADARLRSVPIEVLVRRYRGSPVVQVVRLFEVRADGLYEIDYWCDVCSIAMFELKPCECCQAETVLRHTKVPAAQPAASPAPSRK